MLKMKNKFTILLSTLLFLCKIFRGTVSEFNEFMPRLKYPKNLENLEQLNTKSETNHI